MDNIPLWKFMEECEVQAVSGGHCATFRGTPATFQASGGPSKWTEEMARKAAVFFYALKMEREAIYGKEGGAS